MMPVLFSLWIISVLSISRRRLYFSREGQRVGSSLCITKKYHYGHVNMFLYVLNKDLSHMIKITLPDFRKVTVLIECQTSVQRKIILYLQNMCIMGCRSSSVIECQHVGDTGFNPQNCAKEYVIRESHLEIEIIYVTITMEFTFSNTVSFLTNVQGYDPERAAVPDFSVVKSY